MDNRESKGLGTLLHVTNLAPKALVSSSKDPIEAEGKYLAHKSLIPQMNSHPLIEVAYMLHKVGSPIINDKHRLCKAMGEAWLYQFSFQRVILKSSKGPCSLRHSSCS